MPDLGTSPPHLIPLAVKILYTAFMLVLVPVYWKDYGPANFLYFCDVALFFTLAALWLESPLLASIPLVGIFLPQLLWQVDFLLGIFGIHPTGLTDYMFDEKRPLFTRGLSFFHFWLPLLLLWMVWRLGYDRRALWIWTGLAVALLLVCYFFVPPPPAPRDNPNAPANINYVYGISEEKPQEWMHPLAWLAMLLIGLPLAVFLPTHLLFCWWFAEPSTPPS